mmetsp:Transcript_45635/g.127229  ORF Transcript_45635/g.127229 Transcript_45635/m.127229 type:complete len:279 (-) Transcript_45635:450-1286(-)
MARRHSATARAPATGSGRRYDKVLYHNADRGVGSLSNANNEWVEGNRPDGRQPAAPQQPLTRRCLCQGIRAESTIAAARSASCSSSRPSLFSSMWSKIERTISPMDVPVAPSPSSATTSSASDLLTKPSRSTSIPARMSKQTCLTAIPLARNAPNCSSRRSRTPSPVTSALSYSSRISFQMSGCSIASMENPHPTTESRKPTEYSWKSKWPLPSASNADISACTLRPPNNSASGRLSISMSTGGLMVLAVCNSVIARNSQNSTSPGLSSPVLSMSQVS